MRCCFHFFIFPSGCASVPGSYSFSTEMSANGGNADAQYDIGLVCQHGKGTRQDLKKSC